MVDEFSFVTVDASRSIDAIQQHLRETIRRYLAGELHERPRVQVNEARAVTRRGRGVQRRGRERPGMAKAR